jgi:hypothetical protein
MPYIVRRPLVAALLVSVYATLGAQAPASWPPELDAVRAAPLSHRVLIDNDRVRVLEVIVEPGQQEPVHTHQWPSVMYVTEAGPLRYDVAHLVDGRWTVPPLAARPASATAPTAPARPGDRPPAYLEPEGPHAVSNLGTTRFRAIRVEIKTAR